MTQNKRDLTQGNVRATMLRFVLPYLLSCFLQTFYGLADLFVVGLYNDAAASTGVSIGSQVMHMLTVMLVGLAMGTTVELGHSIGAKDEKRSSGIIASTILLFTVLAAVLTVLLTALTGPITAVMSTPAEAVADTQRYLGICFMGLPFIIAYNVICSVYRGAGDSKSPMIFIAIACAVNIAVDFLFIGGFGLGAAGAAYGTVIGQAVSVLVSLLWLRRAGLGICLNKEALRPTGERIAAVLKVGFPICMQDGLIQIAFILITVIANGRGLIDSVSVGVTEKLISFMFLVPSAFLSATSAITAQNMGAGKAERARQSLRFSLLVTVAWGLMCFAYCQVLPDSLIGLFRREPEIIAAGSAYLRSYSLDCVFAAIHFCFSGYFCGEQKSGISFLHNILSVALIRVTGAYLASLYFPDTLYPMGVAAPLGSLVSALICLGFYLYERRKRTDPSGLK